MKTLILMIFFIFLQVYFLNAEAWKRCSNGITEGITCFAISGEDIFAGSKEGKLFKTTNYGSSWERIILGLEEHQTMCIAVKDSIITLGTSIYGIYTSSDYGNTWSKPVTNTPTQHYINTVEINNNTLFAGITYLKTSRGSIYFSSDTGRNWNLQNTNLPDSIICFLKANTYGLFAASKGQGIFVTTDNGQNWRTSNKGLKDSIVLSLYIDNQNIYAGTAIGSIYLSDDNGMNWNKIDNNQIGSSVLSIATSGDFIFAGTSNKGVFVSYDKGLNWKAINDSLYGKNIPSMVVVGNRLFTTTGGGAGVWSLDISTVSVNDKNTNNDLFISPNPASDYITISLGAINPKVNLGVDENPDVNIYNTLGEKVMSASAQHAVPLRINISDLPKGMYFVKAGGVTAKFVKM